MDNQQKCDLQIIVAVHKPHWLPRDTAYFPVRVGKYTSRANNDSTFACDNTGDNISDKNPYYCELTAMYWAWKHLTCRYIGLCHYRRYFVKNICGIPLHIYNQHDFREDLHEHDIIVPPVTRLTETVYEQYASHHNQRDIDIVRQIIVSRYPDYVDAFDEVMQQREAYFTNIFCLLKSEYDAYCEWLFDILFQVEVQIQDNVKKNYDNYQSRVYGFISERLLNVWIRKQRYCVKEQPIIILDERALTHRLMDCVRRFLN